ncbi:MAG: RNA chaperone Hfq [Oscillospiraceae bacterium]|jgi:host factor-I protein|nr:RNA chaperone Hfq [Oscillospiraceae bacterium]
MQRTSNYQDLFLNQLRHDHQLVTVFLVNGFQIKGVVRGFDDFTVVVEAEGRQQLIYKHAISTLIPSRPVPLPQEEPKPAAQA